MAAAKKVTAEFNLEKDTKNKRMFRETEESKEKQVMGAAYISKAALEQLGDPSKVKITVEAS